MLDVTKQTDNAKLKKAGVNTISNTLEKLEGIERATQMQDDAKKLFLSMLTHRNDGVLFSVVLAVKPYCREKDVLSALQQIKNRTPAENVDMSKQFVADLLGGSECEPSS